MRGVFGLTGIRAGLLKDEPKDRRRPQVEWLDDELKRGALWNNYKFRRLMAAMFLQACRDLVSDRESLRKAAYWWLAGKEAKHIATTYGWERGRKWALSQLLVVEEFQNRQPELFVWSKKVKI